MAKIDRDAAIGVMFRLYEEAAIRWRSAGKSADAGGMIELDRAALELSRLPAEEDRPAFRWIPISEAAPERGRDVLVQMKDGRILNGWVFDEEEMDWFLGTGERYAHNDEIIAWAPLPEPYKEEEQDGERDAVDTVRGTDADEKRP